MHAYILRMMGKRASVYSENRRSELFKEYERAYPELSIYAQRDRDEVIKRQKEEIEELKARLDEMEKRNKERFDKFHEVWKKNKELLESLDKAEETR